MRAIILNSGTGSRMGELTLNRPKCLVEVLDGETILDLQMRSLAAVGLSPVIITTGPFHRELEQHVRGKFPNLETLFVHNSDYSTTNYIYSMHLARHLTDDSLILLHGDMVYDAAVLDMLISSPHADAVTVDPHMPPPEKDFKGRIQGGLVRHIGVDISGDDCVFLLPMYKFSAELFRHWMSEIALFIKAGTLGVYAENALNVILHSASLHPIYLDGQLCMEVDNPNDLDRARSLLHAQPSDDDSLSLGGRGPG